MKKILLTLSASLIAALLLVGAPAVSFAQEASGRDGVSSLATSESEDTQLRAQREAFVESLYANVLGRIPDRVEVDHHATEMEKGRTPNEVAALFFGSEEFANRGFANADAAQIAYIALLGRAASGYEVEIRAGHIDTYGLSFVVSEIIASPEFMAHFEAIDDPVDTSRRGFASRLATYFMGEAMSDDLFNRVANSSTVTDALLAVLQSDELRERGYSERHVAQLVAYVMTGRPVAGQDITQLASYQENGMSEYKLLDAILSRYASDVSSTASAFGMGAGYVTLTQPRDMDINVSGFATRLYTCILGRTPDVPGLNAQCQALLDGFEAITIVNNYFVSEEFSQRVLTNEERVSIAYNTMLNREPEPEGLVYWTKYLDSGMTISSVARGFSQAQEWAELCQQWGLESGTLTLTEPRDQNMEVTAFVSRLYKNVLTRKPDVAGLNVQCEALLSGTPAAQLAKNFFDGEEFVSRPLSNAEIVTVAYNTLLDREPEPYGLEGWTACMDAGMPLEYLVAGFADSDEFLNLCNKYGVERGWLDYDGEKMAEYTKVIAPPPSEPSGPTGPSGGTTVVHYNLTVDQMLDLNYPWIPEYLGYSEAEVRDAIDPATATGSTYLQFADLRQLSGLTASQVDAYIASTPNGRAGTMAGQGAAIVEGCRNAGINEVYVLCHAILETGWGTSDLASGYYYDGTTPVGGEYYPAGTYYNYFGIGAYDTGALSGGRALAIKNGWDSPAKALAGGAAWIARNYTYSSDYPQATIYEMKWDPQRASDTQSYGWHQFATGIVWPATITSIMGHCLSFAGLSADSYSYIVPSYR